MESSHSLPAALDAPLEPDSVGSSGAPPVIQQMYPPPPSPTASGLHQQDPLVVSPEGQVDVEMQDDQPEQQSDEADEGEDELLAMQNNLGGVGTFEDSVRSFVGGGRLKRPPGEKTQPKRQKIKRGPRKAAEPTGDVKLRLNNARQEYLEGRIDTAIEYVNDAIRINAEIHAAWTLLASLLQERGDMKQSLLALVCAAHLQPKIIEDWMRCSEFAMELLEQMPEDADDISQIAIMVLSQIIKLDPKNIGARKTRAELYLQRENYKWAVAEYADVVERSPFDCGAVQGLAVASVQYTDAHKGRDEGKREAALQAYQRCITYYQANDLGPELQFMWEDAIVYIELLAHLKQFTNVLNETRSLARWLLGRRKEEFWDGWDDDREWDEDDERRSEVPEYEPERYPDTAYGKGLPLRLRTKLAISRLRLDQEAEAMRHLDLLDPVDRPSTEGDLEHPELFLEVAATLYETNRFASALRFFEPLRSIPDFLDAEALYQAGKCYLEVGDKRQAEECLTMALDEEDAHLDARINARYELAKMYESARQQEAALIMVEEAMDLEEDREAIGSDDESDNGRAGTTKSKRKRKSLQRKERKPRQRVPKEKKPRERKPREKRPPRERIPRLPRERKPSRRRQLIFALDEDRAREEAERSAYLASKWQMIRQARERPGTDLLEPGDDWSEAARELIDDFRSFKAFYPWDRYLVHIGLRQDRETGSSANPLLLKLAERLRDDLGVQKANPYMKNDSTLVSYRDVSFKDWLDLFLEYALSLAHAGRYKDSYAVCEAAKDAIVFFENPEDLFLIWVTYGACALRARDELQCVEVARYLMAKNTFTSDAYRMYAAICRLCASTATWYQDSRVQKFTLRQIKYMDSHLLPPEKKEKSLEEFDPDAYTAEEIEVSLLMLYGHVLFISNSFTYALNYFVRAHAIDPDNLMINISIGQAYVHAALKRQAENRQHLLVQGFVFLHRYYELKLAAATTAVQRQEAHYNMARSYHAVGLTHLAMEYYVKVFREIEGHPDEEDLCRETAYNLQQCCLAGGDVGAVKALADRWLVL